MRLSTKTLLSFIAVILFQAGLIISILSYFVHQQNNEISVKEMKKEANVVFENYNSWKAHLWKNLIALKNNQVLKVNTRQLTQEHDPKKIRSHLAYITNNIKDMLVMSGIDYVVVMTDKQLIGRGIGDYDVMFSNLIEKLQPHSKSYPYLKNRVLDSHLTLIGTVNLGGDISSDLYVHLIKVINRQFLDKLVTNLSTEVFFIIEDINFKLNKNDPDLSSIIPSSKLNRFYNVLTDLSIDQKNYSGIIKRTADVITFQGEKKMFLATLISGEHYAANTILIYHLIISVFVLGSILAIILSWFLSQNISNPIKDLLKAMKHIKNGKFGTQIKGNYGIEMEELFQGFNIMSKNLNRQKTTMESYLREITALKDYNEKIIDSMSTGILSINQQFIIEKVNSVFLDTFKIQDFELMDKDIRNLDFKWLDVQLYENIKWILTGKITSFTVTKRISPKKVFEIKLYPIYSSESPSACVLMLHNVSKKLELEEKILQAEKLSSISILSAGVAHEINNPLSSIMSHVEYLIEEESRTDELESLKWIQQETLRIGEIVKQLLNFARTNETVAKGTEVNQEILKIINLIQFSQKRVHIQHALENDLPKTAINQNEFKQVIINLLINAIQACGQQGEITIKTSRGSNPKSINIVIEDNGKGIAEEIMPNIFDPFFTTKQLKECTGLGLSVVYGIVTNNHGDIDVESISGKGAVFKISLPCITSAEID